MATSRTRVFEPTRAEQLFYDRYAWCLNPLQSLSQLFARLDDELTSYATLEIEWQQEEARINIFLLTSAISCTVSDYLAPSLPSFPKIASRWRRSQQAVQTAGDLITATCRLQGFLSDRSVHAWHDEWRRCVDLSCVILLRGCPANSPEMDRITEISRRLARSVLPSELKSLRMQLPSGFLAQDLTHHDVIALANAFTGRYKSATGELVIVGARTAGAYFASLFHAVLQQDGWNSQWMSFRPKGGLSWWEKKELCNAARHGKRVVLIDDHPDTGETIRIALDLLSSCGIKRHDITVVVPSHEAQRSPSVLTGGYTDVDCVTLAPEKCYKHRVLSNGALESLLAQFVSSTPEAVQFVEDEATNAINRTLQTHLQDDFQVHIKRVYALRTQDNQGKLTRVIAKSVGWGWLGYHAYFAGTRLREFVPRVYGLRQGMLFSEWIDADHDADFGEPESVTRIAAYIAARTRLLSLPENPSLDQVAFKVGGWYSLAKVLRGVFPRYQRWLRMRALWLKLTAHASPQPTFIDGKFNESEWINAGSKLTKLDYEHHGFGNPAPNVVDAGYDLALASLQLKLSPEAQQCLLNEFVKITGDEDVRERFVLHALACGYRAGEYARFHAARALTSEARKQFEASRNHARDFLTSTLCEFCAKHFLQAKPLSWSDRLFFMDLDGVFDRSYLYFPHTTPTGLAAIGSLNRHGYSVVINTARPLSHVRMYCAAYPLAGGIAECGCVYFDSIKQRQTLLIDGASQEQLNSLRERWRDFDAVYLDDTYEFAIRAFAMKNGRSISVPEGLIREALQDFPRLTSFSSTVDTYIFPSDAGKGEATNRVMQMHSIPREATAAIGDSEMDLPMLSSVAKAYVPANAPKSMLRQDGNLAHTILQSRFQHGLMEAVRNLTGDSQCSSANSFPVDGKPEHILEALLKVADRSRWEHLMAVARIDRL